MIAETAALATGVGVRRGTACLPSAAWKRGTPADRQARMDQRERADKIEPMLAAEPIENAEASEPTDATDRIELDTQRRFYRDALGLPELAAGPDWVQFDFGQAGFLEIVQRSNAPQYDRARYQVGYAADVESAREHLCFPRGAAGLRDRRRR